MAWTTITQSAATWGNTTNAAQTWGSTETVSGATRLNRIFPQSAVTQENLSFMWRIRTTPAFFVATGSGVYLKSGITESV